MSGSKRTGFGGVPRSTRSQPLSSSGSSPRPPGPWLSRGNEAGGHNRARGRPLAWSLLVTEPWGEGSAHESQRGQTSVRLPRPSILEPPALSPRLNDYFSRAFHPACPLRKDAPAGRDLRPLSSPFISHFTDTRMDMLGPEAHSPVMTDVSGNRDLLTFSPVSFLFPVPPRGGDTTVSHLISCWYFNFLMLPRQEILPFYNPDPQALLQAPFPLSISSVNTGKSPRSLREGASSRCPYHLMP